jgi:hypothetical protein
MFSPATTQDNAARQGFSSPLVGRAFMLQWKARLFTVLALAALAVAIFGGYAGDAGDTLRQFGW